MNSNRTEPKAKSNRAPCIWMQSGVVRRKSCEIDYHCETCRFDRALGRVARENRELRRQGKTPTGRRRKIVFWKERLRELSPSQQPCLHHMKRRIDFRTCTHDYQCGNCEFSRLMSLISKDLKYPKAIICIAVTPGLKSKKGRRSESASMILPCACWVPWIESKRL